MKHIWLDRNIMVSPIYYCLCLTERQFHSELKRLKVDRDSWPSFIKKDKWANATVNFFQYKDKHCAIVCMNITDETLVQAHCLLVHESVHIWQEICEIIGESNPSSEFEAYSIQYLSQQLILSYEKLKKKSRKNTRPRG
jgi:hypothetical protein